MVGANRFLNNSGRPCTAIWHMVSRLGYIEHTSKGLPEATMGCKCMLLCRHSGRLAARFDTIEWTGRGKSQSTYGSFHASFPDCCCLYSTFFVGSYLRSALAVVCIMDSTANICADALQQERLHKRFTMHGSTHNASSIMLYPVAITILYRTIVRLYS